MEPEALLFDEPTLALDPELTGEVLRTIRGLAEEGRTMILVTHELSFACEVSSCVAFMPALVEVNAPVWMPIDPSRISLVPRDEAGVFKCRALKPEVDNRSRGVINHSSILVARSRLSSPAGAGVFKLLLPNSESTSTDNWDVSRPAAGGYMFRRGSSVSFTDNTDKLDFYRCISWQARHAQSDTTANPIFA